jgi:hypothetical protein
LIEDPIVAHAQAVKLVFAFDLFDSRRKGVLGKRINPLLDPPSDRTVEGLEVSFRPRRELDSFVIPFSTTNPPATHSLVPPEPPRIIILI